MSEIDSSEFGGLYISIVAVVDYMIYFISSIQSMKHMDMHEISDCMDWSNKFGMILACNEYKMIGYKSGMKLVWMILLYTLLEQVVVMVRT